MRKQRADFMKKEIEKDQVQIGAIDMPFLMLVFIILAIGIVMLFSASHANALTLYGDSYYFIQLQLRWVAIGTIAMFAAIVIPLKIYKLAPLPLYGLTIVLLIMVRLTGSSSHGGTRWLVIFGQRFQPSELAKIAIVLMFAFMIAKYKKKMDNWYYFVPFLVVLGVAASLVLAQPHLSGALIIIGVGAIMVFVGGINKWVAVIGLGLALVGVLLFLGTDILKGYQSDRIDMWLNPESDAQGKGFQILQSLYAIASGGFMGRGLGNSIQKYNYVPEPQNDSIFAIICEEVGFAGAVIIIMLFVLLIWRGFAIASKSTDVFSMMTVIGIMSMLGIQVFLNIAVATNFIPTTGISLPFFSYGGTALLLQMFMMGIVLNISRYSYVEKQ